MTAAERAVSQRDNRGGNRFPAFLFPNPFPVTTETDKAASVSRPVKAEGERTWPGQDKDRTERTERTERWQSASRTFIQQPIQVEEDTGERGHLFLVF